MGDALAHGAERATATAALERIRQRLNLPRPVPHAGRPLRCVPETASVPSAPQPNPRAQPPTNTPSDRASRATAAPAPVKPVAPGDVAGDAAPKRLNAFLSALSKCTNLPASVLLASFFLNFLGLALPLAMLQIYDRILPNQATDTLLLLSIGLGAAFFLEAVLKIVRSHVMGWAAVHVGFRREMAAVTHLLHAPPSEVKRSPAGDWMDSFDALGELNVFFGGNSRLILIDLPFTVIFLVMILMIGGWLILVPLTLIAVFATMTILRGRILRDVLATRADQDNKRYDFIVECLAGIHTIKGLAMESLFQRRFERLHKSSALASYNTVLIGNKVQAIGSLFANVTQISLVTVGALMVMEGVLSIGSLVCCSLLSSRLTQPVIRGLDVWSELQNIELAEKRAERFDALDAAQTEVGALRNADGVPEFRGRIEFSNVSFASSGPADMGLRGISLEIAPGEFVGLRGEDGGGRSTLASLINGDIEPSQGTVRVDGLRPSRECRHLLNRYIGYAAACPVVFDGTILENITMFGPRAKAETARWAARLIGLEADIYHLPEGYDTLLAQGVGDSLSSGLTQRITVARALATDPTILIFDEANTLLDKRSDRLLLEGLAQLKGKVTTILISNRPSTLRLADRVFELRGGRLEVWDGHPAISSPIVEPASEPVVA